MLRYWSRSQARSPTWGELWFGPIVGTEAHPFRRQDWLRLAPGRNE